jgi:hypothetical protein
MNTAEEDRGAHTSYADQIVCTHWDAIAIAIGIAICETQKVGTAGSTGEEAARKEEVVLGVEPINCFNRLLDWHLHSQQH